MITMSIFFIPAITIIIVTIIITLICYKFKVKKLNFEKEKYYNEYRNNPSYKRNNLPTVNDYN